MESAAFFKKKKKKQLLLRLSEEKQVLYYFSPFEQKKLQISFPKLTTTGCAAFQIKII